MKRIFKIFIVLIIVCSSFFISGCKYNEEVNPEKYLEVELLEDNTYEVVGSKGAVYNTVIPSTFEGIAITRISRRAFYGGGFSVNLELGSVVIHEGITHIDEEAFCLKRIKEIKLPESLEYIGAEAFSFTRSQINFPSNLKFIGDSSFENTYLNKDIVINEDTILGDNIFNNTNINSIEFLGERQTIPNSIALQCNDLSNIILPRNLETIEGYAFTYTNLTNVVFPDTLKEISKGAFSSTKLEEVILPESIEIIGSNAFSNITTLSNVEFYSNPILDRVFEDCISIDTVLFSSEYMDLNGSFINTEVKNKKLPSNSIWKLYSNCLYYVDGNKNILVLGDGSLTTTEYFDILDEYSCSGIHFTSLIVTDNTILNEGVFYKSFGLDITINTNVYEHTFYHATFNSVVINCNFIDKYSFVSTKINDLYINCNNIGNDAFYFTFATNVYIEEGVTNIGDEAFYLSKFINVHLPTTLLSVEQSAFGNCATIKNIYYTSSEVIYLDLNIIYSNNSYVDRWIEGLTIHVSSEIYDECLIKWSVNEEGEYSFRNTLSEFVKINE